MNNERKMMQVMSILRTHFSPRDQDSYRRAALDIVEEMAERVPARDWPDDNSVQIALDRRGLLVVRD